MENLQSHSVAGVRERDTQRHSIPHATCCHKNHNISLPNTHLGISSYKRRFPFLRNRPLRAAPTPIFWMPGISARAGARGKALTHI